MLRGTPQVVVELGLSLANFSLLDHRRRQRITSKRAHVSHILGMLSDVHPHRKYCFPLTFGLDLDLNVLSKKVSEFIAVEGKVGEVRQRELGGVELERRRVAQYLDGKRRIFISFLRIFKIRGGWVPKVVCNVGDSSKAIGNQRSQFEDGQGYGLALVYSVVGDTSGGGDTDRIGIQQNGSSRFAQYVDESVQEDPVPAPGIENDSTSVEWYTEQVPKTIQLKDRRGFVFSEAPT